MRDESSTQMTHLHSQVHDALLVDVRDAASQLRSEPPELVVILDALAVFDAIAQLAHDQLADSKENAGR